MFTARLIEFLYS